MDEKWLKCVGKGWHKILSDLFMGMSIVPGTIEILQVKEKFGGLRVYYNYKGRNSEHDDYLYNITQEAEKLSYKTCENCGDPGTLRKDRRWILTLCETCNEKK